MLYAARIRRLSDCMIEWSAAKWNSVKCSKRNEGRKAECRMMEVRAFTPVVQKGYLYFSHQKDAIMK